jgi:hypothetical protein
MSDVSASLLCAAATFSVGLVMRGRAAVETTILTVSPSSSVKEGTLRPDTVVSMPGTKSCTTSPGKVNVLRSKKANLFQREAAMMFECLFDYSRVTRKGLNKG